jgi:uncharacterized membrane protein YkgB
LARSSPAAHLGLLGRHALWLFLGLVFLIIGLLKLTPYEAAMIRPLAEPSPLLGWCYRLWGVRGASAVFGLIEIPIGIGLLIGLFRPRSTPAKLAALGAAITCLVTVSFLFTAPGVIAGHTVLHLPLLSLQVGQFLLKDLVLLAAALVLVGESW